VRGTRARAQSPLHGLIDPVFTIPELTLRAGPRSCASAHSAGLFDGVAGRVIGELFSEPSPLFAVSIATLRASVILLNTLLITPLNREIDRRTRVRIDVHHRGVIGCPAIFDRFDRFARSITPNHGVSHLIARECLRTQPGRGYTLPSTS